MKNSLLITTITLLPILLLGQTCDEDAVYNTTGANAVCIEVVDRVRYCYTNNYPNHSDDYTQNFTLTEQDHEYNMCAFPEQKSWTTSIYESVETTAGCTDNYRFGVLLNGVRLAPSATEYFVNDDGSNNMDWNVEATSTTTSLGQSMGTLNGGHMTGNGYYHYHKAPEDYLTNDLGIDGSAHSPIVGYAADGFPIYYKYVYQNPNDANSPVVTLSSGYSLRSGSRPGDGLTAPDGTYDGTYYEDYEYTTTVLDSCNGRFAVTPDYPYGTYYYVLTDNYPYIPRCFKGAEIDHTYRVGPTASCPSSESTTNCPAKVEGCMDPFATNYNPSANSDNGSCSYAPLPVELVDFQAEQQNENVLLHWETATEVNNDYFEIQWSWNGLDFESIGKVNGNGSTIHNQLYEFIHLNPVHGKNYYRLKQVDFDGEYEYSETIALLIQSDIQKQNLKIYPNPTKGFLTIESNTNEMVSIRNLYGQVVLQHDIKGKKQLDITHLASGVYFIDNGYQTKKLIINQ